MSTLSPHLFRFFSSPIAIPSILLAFLLWKVGSPPPHRPIGSKALLMYPQIYAHSRRDRGTVPRAPHLIPWIGNLKALLLDPVYWPCQMLQKYVSPLPTLFFGNFSKLD